jgi:YbbR domain-containing protein
MWRRIFQNFWFKLVAVVMALLLWLNVATDRVYQYTERFPLEITDIPQQLLLAEKPPDHVNVTVEGKGKELLKLILAEKKSLKIDAAEFKRGETDYTVKPEDVPIPEDLELTVTTILPPKNLKVRLDYSMEKPLPVKPEVRVIPADGYEQVGGLHYSPKEVVISGPRMWLRNLQEIQTQKQEIQDAKESVSGQLGLVLPEGYNLSLSQDKINYSANVERTEERETPARKISPVNLARKAEVELRPDSVTLTFVGAQSLIDQLEPDSIRVFVDCSQVSRRDTVKLPVRVDLPAGIRLVSAQPDSVQAVLK